MSYQSLCLYFPLFFSGRGTSTEGDKAEKHTGGSQQQRQTP